MHQMKDARLAEAICDRMYDAQHGGRAKSGAASWSGLATQPNYDVYLSLIQVSMLHRCQQHSLASLISHQAQPVWLVLLCVGATCTCKSAAASAVRCAFVYHYLAQGGWCQQGAGHSTT